MSCHPSVNNDKNHPHKKPRNENPSDNPLMKDDKSIKISDPSMKICERCSNSYNKNRFSSHKCAVREKKIIQLFISDKMLSDAKNYNTLYKNNYNRFQKLFLNSADPEKLINSRMDSWHKKNGNSMKEKSRTAEVIIKNKTNQVFDIWEVIDNIVDQIVIQDKNEKRKISIDHSDLKLVNFFDDFMKKETYEYKLATNNKKIPRHETYGELEFNSIVESILPYVRDTDVFLDVGSGVGNVVLVVALKAKCISLGIEIHKLRSQLSMNYLEKVKKKFPFYELRNIFMKEGDFSDMKCEFGIKASVVYMNNKVFGSKLMYEILLKISLMRNLHTLIVTEKICSKCSNLCIKKKNYCSMFLYPPVTVEVEVSWVGKENIIYIYHIKK